MGWCLASLGYGIHGSALAHSGTTSSTYTNALATLLLYTALAAAGTITLFQHRDA